MSYQEHILEKHWSQEAVKDCFAISRIERDNKDLFEGHHITSLKRIKHNENELKAILGKYNIEL